MSGASQPTISAFPSQAMVQSRMQPGKSSQVPHYSVVIRTWNSERTLRKTLGSLKIQTARPDEIIIVDSGSTDGTIAIATEANARIIHYPRDALFNYSKSLNIGMAAAKSEFVMVISSHTVVPHKFTVEAMLKALEFNDVVGAYCVTAWTGNGVKQSLHRNGPLRTSMIDKSNFDGYNGLWNSCSLIRKSAWQRHPFDETSFAAEDQQWAHWHFNHDAGRTMRLEGVGTLDLNHRRSKWKAARDHVAIASRCCPEFYQWRAIFKRFVNAFFALTSFKRALFKQELLYGSVLLFHRIGLLRFESQYHAGPPWWLAWLAR